MLGNKRPGEKPLIFISYSHEDEEPWLPRIRTFLGPAMKNGVVEVWDDRRLFGGDEWKKLIREKLAICHICILLVSANSMHSDYVMKEEISRILERRKDRENVVLYPIILTPTPKTGLEAIKGFNFRPKDGVPLSAFDERHGLLQELSKIADELTEMLDNWRPYEPSAEAEGKRGRDRQRRRSHQAELAIEWLAGREVHPFFLALQSELAELPEVGTRAGEPADTVDMIECCPAARVDDVLVAIHAALVDCTERLEVRSPAQTKIERAAAALYFLAACRLVDREGASPKRFLFHVPHGESVICAIVATSLFGGRLELRRADGSDLPLPQYVFRVQPAQGSEALETEELERALYIDLFRNREDTPDISLDSGPLSAQQRAHLKRELKRIRRVRKRSLTLVMSGPVDGPTMDRFAAELEAPIMVHDKEAASILLGMKAEDLIAAIQSFWAELKHWPQEEPDAEPGKPPSGGDGRAPAA